MMSLNTRSQLTVFLCGFLGSLILANASDAQTGGDPSPSINPAISPLPKGDIIYLKNQSGRPVPVPRNASVQEYLKWLEEREQQEEARIPDYDLISLSLKGTANERSAELDAIVSLRIRKKEGAVRVPLQFQEAVLKKIAHEGAGDFAFVGLNNKAGYEWNISGAGLHQLTLKLSVPLTRQLPMRRLQLTVPQSPVSSLELAVGVPNAAFKLPQRSAFEITPAGQQTILTLFGLSESLDLSWQSAPESNSDRSVLEASTRIETKLSYGNVILTARQQVEAVSGNFDQFQIRLPESYQLQSLQVKDDLLESISAVEGSKGWYRVQLSTATSGPVELDWILSRPLPGPGELIEIDGFEVQGEVRQQSGQIHLVEMSRYRLLTQAQDSLFRIDVPESSSGQIARSWEFFQQPFQLSFELQKIRPLYSITPSTQLTVEEESLVWNADLDLTVYRGSLDELSLRWPRWQEEEWQLSTETRDGLVDRIRVDESDPDVLYLTFAEPLSPGQSQLSLTARKPFSLGADPIPIQLPRFPAAAEPAETLLTVNALRKYEVGLETTSDVRTIPVTSIAEKTNPRVTIKTLRFPQTSTRTLDLTIQEREREIAIESLIRLEYGTVQSTIQVDQQLKYGVEYEGLETLRFRVPEAVSDSLVVVDQEGRPLNLEYVSESTNGQARVSLSEPLLGSYSIRFQYEVDLSASRDPDSSQWQIPLIQSSDADSKMLRLTLGNFLFAQFQPIPEGWQMATTPEGEIYYQSEAPGVRQELVLQRQSQENRSQSVSVRKSLHLASTDGEGVLSLRSEYLIAGSSDNFRIQIPNGYQVDQIFLDGESIEHSKSGENAIVVNLEGVNPLQNHREHRLSLLTNIQSPKFRFGWTGEFQCDAPQLVDANWHQESMWLVELPYRHHLFVQPKAFAPLNTWQRQGLFWVRSPQLSEESLAEWIGSEPSTFEGMFVTGGNYYLFHKLGDGSQIALKSMHRSMVVLAGAGLTLLVSFVLLRMPTTRNALTLLMIALVLAVAGVFYPTSVALLLQPAILGFGLACLAAFLDNLFRRPQLPNAVITFEEPSRGSSQHSQIPHPPIAQIDQTLGSEDPTEMRPRAITEEQVSSFIIDGE